MVANTLNIVRWEWFKVSRRWMPWVLLVILILFTQLSVWGGLFSYSRLKASGGEVPLPGAEPNPRGQVASVACNDLRNDPAAVLPAGTSQTVINGLLALCNQQAHAVTTELQNRYDNFSAPSSLSRAFGVARGIGLILLAILTASMVGAEYGLGTLRSTISRGIGRRSYLAGKFILLAAMAAGALVIVSLLVIVSSLIATSIAGGPAAGVVSSTTTWTDGLIDFGRTWVAMLPYIILTGTLTLVTRSSAAGMATGLGYYFAEGILIALLTNLFDWFQNVADYLPVRNIDAFAGGSGRGGPFSPNVDLSLMHSGLVLAAYALVLGFIAVRLFSRRDVTGPSAG